MFLLDTDSFLSPANGHYAFDICPGYWDWIADAGANDVVASVHMVRVELRQKDDHIRHWTDTLSADLFKHPSPEGGRKMQELADWANNGFYHAQAVADFLDKADAFLVAHAMAHEGTVVTYEVPENSPSKIKIPSACEQHGISCAKPYEMLRARNVVLKW